jgi:DNA polymerase I-like protein with 3'-5' exonuclease and polymerase domains
MNIITLDFETYWSATHTLSKMSPIAYVMHPETEIQSVSIKINKEPTEVYFGKDIRPALNKIDWKNALVVGHNMSGFDCMILAWRYGINPKMWSCTLAMARPLHTKTCGLSLKALAEHYGLGVKDNTVLLNTKGRKLADFTDQELIDMRVYNKEDTELCYALLKKLRPQTTTREMVLVDVTIRMLTEPKFEADVSLLETTLKGELERKKLMLLDIATMIGVYAPGMSDEQAEEAARGALASAKKFGEILTACGVEVPMKQSPSNPDKEVPALAKTDEAFIALQEHDDQIVATAALARLGVKSTQLETRINKFLQAASFCDGRIPAPIKYAGADTTLRWSGDQYNLQNLPRIGITPKPTDALRNSLRAPKGYKVVVADLSGIELRVNMFLWKVPYAMQLFKDSPDKADLYRYFAAHDLFNITEEEVTKPQRQVGKVSHLGLGFGSGAITFKGVAKTMGGVILNDVESKGTVDKYRGAHPEIVAGWKSCQTGLMQIFQGSEMDIDPWGLCKTVEGGIKTPMGMIRYPGLHQETANGKKEWWYGTGRHRARIYGPKMVENIVQHLAREVVADNMLSVQKLTGHSPCLTVHDELVYIVKESEAQALLDTVQQVMRTPPVWWPELITWSEGDIAQTYGEAK